MANKLETIAENKKKAILAKQEEDVARFANKVANQVLSKVDFSHSEHSTKELQEIISGLSTAVAGAIVLSNEKIDGNLKDNFSQLLNAVKNNKPDNTNQVKLNKEIGRSLAKFELALDAMEFAPQITVAGLSQEELKMEVDKILAKLPSSTKREISIAYEKATADKYINVRLTDGIKFYSAFSSGGGGGGDISAIKGFALGQYDAIEATYPSSSSEQYTYKLAGETVAIVTVTYTDSTKEVLSSVVKS